MEEGDKILPRAAPQNAVCIIIIIIIIAPVLIN